MIILRIGIKVAIIIKPNEAKTSIANDNISKLKSGKVILIFSARLNSKFNTAISTNDSASVKIKLIVAIIAVSNKKLPVMSLLDAPTAESMPISLFRLVILNYTRFITNKTSTTANVAHTASNMGETEYTVNSNA